MNYDSIYQQRQLNASMTDQEFLTFANEIISDIHEVPIRDLQFYADTSGLTATFMMAAESTNDQVRMIAKIALNIFASRYQFIDLSLPTTKQVVAGLLAAGLATQDNIDAIGALGPHTIVRRCNQWGFQEVTVDALACANKSPAIAALINEVEQRRMNALMILQQNLDSPNSSVPANLDGIL